MSIYLTNLSSQFSAELDNELNNIYDSENKIHISIKQRNARQTVTIIENLDTIQAIKKENIPKVLKEMKRKFSCGGSLVNNEKSTNNDKLAEDDKSVIKLQGDNREKVKAYLKQEFKLDNSCFVIHG